VENRQTLLSEGLLIAGVPLAGYSIALAHEYGYAGYYGIPWQFISLTLTHVLAAIAGLVALLCVLFSFYNIAYSVFWQGNDPHPAIVSLSRLAPLLLLFLGSLLIFGARWQEWAVTLGVVVFLGFFEFIFPLVTQRDKTTYREKLLAQEAHERSITMPLDVAAKAYGNQPIRLLAYIGLAVLMAFFAGRGEAINEKNYYVDSSNPNVVILRFYGDTVVAQEYDPRGNKLTGNLLVTKISDKQPLHFKMKELGHLERPTL
jgi:hypothetical protein